MKIESVPSHVPPHLVRDFDYFDLAGEADVFEHFRKLHAGPDIFYSPHHGGHWVTTRHAHMDAIFANAADFSNRVQTVPRNPIVIPLLEFDGAIHQDFRRLVTPFFAPKNIARLTEVATKLTNDLIDGFVARGECEFVRDFSQRMPIMILMNLLDLPAEDTPYLLKISEDIVRSGDTATQNAAFGRVFAYIATQVIPKRRAHLGDDIFSAVMRGTVDSGRAVTDDELMGLGSLLIAAGLDTVAGMLGFITMFLARSPAHRQQLAAQPERINNALEELLRRFSISNISRIATRDLEFEGIEFKQGDCVLLSTSCAGIDAHQFKDPLTVDFDRIDKRSLVFGYGAHHCIGMNLARAELRVFLREWLRRIPEFAIKPGEKPRAVAGKANSVRYLPLVWNVD